jgi:hypothetical protein
MIGNFPHWLPLIAFAVLAAFVVAMALSVF